MIKILYLHSNQQDYLADSLLHGLRSILGINCVDIPRVDYMYDTMTPDQLHGLRGHGMTLYGMLTDLPGLSERRNMWQIDLEDYKYIIFSSVWRLDKYFSKKIVKLWNRCIFVDGEDHPSFFPYGGSAGRSVRKQFLRVGQRPYYKRELYSDGSKYGRAVDIVPVSMLRHLLPTVNTRQIAFSIPLVKISRSEHTVKHKDFPRHIVDSEISAMVQDAVHSPLMSERYAFKYEEDYYTDLRVSRYGITMKRAGWDCMRHYEIAANGSLLCFRDLHKKPPLCAPHGLDSLNSICYANADDLIRKIRTFSRGEYQDRLAATYGWILNNSTIARAETFLSTLI